MMDNTLNERKKNLRNIGFTISTRKFSCLNCGREIPKNSPYYAVKQTPYFSDGRVIHPASEKYCPKCQIRTKIEERREKKRIKVISDEQLYPICRKCGEKVTMVLVSNNSTIVTLICRKKHEIIYRREE
jgi:hypothetical protein